MTNNLKFITELAKEASEMALLNLDKIKAIKEKGNRRSVCTNIDYEVEDMIVEKIQKKFPGHNIIREERDNIDKKSDYTWAIDPIDGTRYFVHGVKLFTTSIALLFKDKPILGAVCHPGTRDLFYAEVNKGSFCNDKALHVSNINKLSEALVNLNTGGLTNISQLEKVKLKKG